MRRFLRKPRRLRGETLVETLVAVLVCGLAAAMLMSAIATASMLNQGAKTTTRQEQVQSDNAARYSGYWNGSENVASSTGTVTFADRDDASLAETFDGADVKVYGGELIVSYGIEVEGA